MSEDKEVLGGMHCLQMPSLYTFEAGQNSAKFMLIPAHALLSCDLLVLSQVLFSDLFALEQPKSSTFSPAQHSIKTTQPLTVVAIEGGVRLYRLTSG